MSSKEMLSAILTRGTLTERERESFTDMWDRIHRFGRCSDKQKAWIEKVYFGQKLNEEAPPLRRRVVIPNWQHDEKQRQEARAAIPVPGESRLVKTNSKDVRKRLSTKSGTFALTPPAVAEAPKSGQKIGFINYPGIQRETPVTNLLHFEEVCPRIEKGSQQYQKIAAFFAKGGMVLKVKPLIQAQVA